MLRSTGISLIYPAWLFKKKKKCSVQARFPSVEMSALLLLLLLLLSPHSLCSHGHSVKKNLSFSEKRKGKKILLSAAARIFACPTSASVSACVSASVAPGWVRSMKRRRRERRSDFFSSSVLRERERGRREHLGREGGGGGYLGLSACMCQTCRPVLVCTTCIKVHSIRRNSPSRKRRKKSTCFLKLIRQGKEILLLFIRL